MTGNESDGYDAAVIGGGVMGCLVALHLALGGIRAVVLERGSLCREASGVNVGTLTLQFAEAAAVPYLRRGQELWRTAGEWLGRDLGYAAKGVITLAFTDAEAALLERSSAERARAGVPNEIVGVSRAREIEPAITERAVLASHCRLDGFADASRTVTAARIVLAGGAWLGRMAEWLGLELPFGCYVNQMVVTERAGPILGSTIGVVRRKLTLKQAANGTLLIGGGWQGEGDPERGGVTIVPRNLTANVRLARHAVPALGRTRVVRTWVGLQDWVPDRLPVIGPLPGIDGAFIIGCGRSGFTMAPYVCRLLADLILGREADLIPFDPARLTGMPGSE